MLSVLDIFKFLEISQKKILLKPMSSMFDKVDAVVRTATLIITSPFSSFFLDQYIKRTHSCKILGIIKILPLQYTLRPVNYISGLCKTEIGV